MKKQNYPLIVPVDVAVHAEGDEIVSVQLHSAAIPHQGEWSIEGEYSAALLKMLTQWMEDYQGKKDSTIQLPLRLHSLPSFLRRVLEALQDIPFGKGVSYQWIARQLLSPRAARAVGTACGKNPFPFIIPCHRVLRAGGHLGGFGCGVEVKQTLLEFENISFR